MIIMIIFNKSFDQKIEYLKISKLVPITNLKNIQIS